MSTTRSIRRIAVAGLLGLSLVAAGCGNDDTDTASDDAATTTVADEMGSGGMTPFGPACDSIPDAGKGSFAGMAEDPAATAASNNPALSTLVTAVGAADLVDTLNGDGPFTIFAPVNDAFAKIPAADLDAVLADKAQLSKILTYHVVAGKMTAEDLASAGSVKTVEGGELTISGSATEPKVGDASVVCGDITVGNGIVHLIDTVLMPPADSMGGDAMGASTPTGPGCAAVPADGPGSFTGMADDPAATAASNNPALTTLVSAVTAADLVDTLNGDGPFTIFAPVNDAFAKIPAADLDAVLADKDQLTKILTFHVAAGKMTAADLAKAGKVTTVEGGELTITAEGDSAKVNDATVVCADVPVANGVVHLIDTVLMPGS